MPRRPKKITPIKKCIKSMPIVCGIGVSILTFGAWLFGEAISPSKDKLGYQLLEAVVDNDL